MVMDEGMLALGNSIATIAIGVSGFFLAQAAKGLERIIRSMMVARGYLPAEVCKECQRRRNGDAQPSRNVGADGVAKNGLLRCILQQISDRLIWAGVRAAYLAQGRHCPSRPEAFVVFAAEVGLPLSSGMPPEQAQSGRLIVGGLLPIDARRPFP